MRTALETTQVRRRNRASRCRRRAWSPLGAVRLLLADVESALADVESALRDQLGVGRPAVGAVEADTPALHPLQ